MTEPGGRLRCAGYQPLWKPSYHFDAAWNTRFCREVRRQVDVPVLQEGGIRRREQADRLLGYSCDAVGMGRPFYAEPRLGERLLGGAGEFACESCNNCTVPQVTGADGVCRTAGVLGDTGGV